MDAGLSIEEIQETDIKNAFDLHNAYFNDHRTEALWEWEYRGQYPDRYVFVVVKDKDRRIVGTNGLYPLYLSIKDETVLCGRSENTLLHPDYRKGVMLFKKYYDYSLSKGEAKGMKCFFGMTPLGLVWKGLLGFKVYPDILYDARSIYCLTRTLSMMLRSKRKIRQKAFEVLTTTMHGLYSKYHYLRLKFKGVSGKYSLSKHLRSKSDLDMLFNTLRKRQPDLISIQQDGKFLDWRLYQNPNIRYSTLFAYTGKKLVGYCYFGFTKENTVALSDLVFLDRGIADFLILSAMKEWKKKRPAFIGYFGNISNKLSREAFEYLCSIGFLKKKNDMSFVIKNRTFHDGGQIYNIKNWYVNGLWLEGYTS